MQRIRKDSETMSNSGYSTVSRARRESDRLRGEYASADNPYAVSQRNPPATREVK